MTNILERYAEKVAMEEQQEDVSLDKDSEDTTTPVQDDTPDAEDTDLVSTGDVSITEDDDAEDLDDTDTDNDTDDNQDDDYEDTDDNTDTSTDDDVEDTDTTNHQDDTDDDSYTGDDDTDGYDAGDIDPDEDDDSGDLDGISTDTSEDGDTDDNQDDDYEDTSEDTDGSEEDEDETEKKSDTVDEDDIATEEMNNILSSYFLSEEGFEEVITCFNSANAVATLEDNKEYIPKEVYTVSMEAIVTPIGLTYYSTEEDGENKGFFAKIFSAIAKFFKGVGKKISEMFKWIGEKLTGKTKDTASRVEKYKEMVDANKAKLEAASGVINGLFGKLGSVIKGTGNYVMKGSELVIEGSEKLWDTELRKKVTDSVAELSKDTLEVVGDALGAATDAGKTVAVKTVQTASKKIKEKYREVRGLDERDINKAAAKLIEDMETDPEIAKGVFGDNRDGQAYLDSLRRAGETEYNKVKNPITKTFRLRDELLKKEREYRGLSNTDPQTDEIENKLKDINHEINKIKSNIYKEEKKYEEFTKKYNITKNNKFFGIIKDTAINSTDESNLEKVKDRIVDTIMISKLVHDLEPRYNKLTGRLSNKPSYQEWIATAGRTGKNRVTGNIVAELAVLQNQVVQWMENITRGREMLYDPKIVQFYMDYPESILNFVSGDSEIDGLNRYAEQVSNSYEDCISKMVSVANVGWKNEATKSGVSVKTKLPAGYRDLDTNNAPSGSMIDENKQKEILKDISSAMDFPDVPKIGKLEYTPGPEIKSNSNGKIKGSLKTMSTSITSVTSHKRFKITFLSGKLELKPEVGAEELSLVNEKINSSFGEDPDPDQIKDTPVNSATIEKAMQYIFKQTSITSVRKLDNDVARFEEVGKWLGAKAAELRSRLSTLGKFETINSNIEAINKSIDSVLSKFSAESSRLGSETNATDDNKKRLINNSMGRFKSLFTFFSTLMSKVLKNLVMILKAYTSDFNYYNKVLDQQIQAVGLIVNASGSLSNKADEYEAKYQEADEYARSSGSTNILPNKVDPRMYDDPSDTEE